MATPAANYNRKSFNDRARSIRFWNAGPSGLIPSRSKVGSDFGLFMQDKVQQGTVDFDAAFAFIVYQPQFSELVHEEADPGSGRADHLR